MQLQILVSPPTLVMRYPDRFYQLVTCHGGCPLFSYMAMMKIRKRHNIK
jgi:hypothetical protein